ncbi:hypothetical protein C7S18_05765 [Ahniella affigens]|uniref:Uncharacterized protein n=1 Tax=Ahniella affigens TaxID=2021234 RepID=A0A2P1PPG9_9GAMM|nr:hypothetical protein C7S18_05765 [Ahniella affigens]
MPHWFEADRWRRRSGQTERGWTQKFLSAIPNAPRPFSVNGLGRRGWRLLGFISQAVRQQQRLVRQLGMHRIESDLWSGAEADQACDRAGNRT